jgi:ABC-type nitrate/sulfonate/bicarbonate transport system substrate-binding protein
MSPWWTRYGGVRGLLLGLLLVGVGCGSRAGVGTLDSPTARPAAGGQVPAAVDPAVAGGAPSAVAPDAGSRLEPTPRARAAGPLTTVKLGIVTTGWSSQTPLAIAQQLGYFQDEGLVVEMRTVPSGGPVMVAMLVSGDADLILSGIEAQVAAITAGAPAVIVGTVLDRLDYALAGARGLNDVEDLRGKLVATTGAGTQSGFAVVEALRRLGLERNRDYWIRAVGSSPVRLSALYSGQIDAVPLGAEDRVQVESDGFPVLVEVGKVLPEFPFTALAASRAFASAQPESTAGLLRAVGRAMEFGRENRDRAVALGKAHGLEGEPAVARKALDLVADGWRVAVTRERIGTMLAAREIAGAPEDFFDDRYLRLGGLAR